MIQLTDVTKTYDTPEGPVTALRSIHLTVNPGEIFGIIGRSGAGKSTLIRCVNLLEKPSQGSIVVDGQSLTTLTPKTLRGARRNIGMIFQHFNLLSSRTVLDNIALPLELQKHTKKYITETIKPLLALVGLQDKQNCYPDELSGGQKQRVAIARALANNPNVLLCDEATSALDPETTDAILHLLEKIRHDLSVTILLITHDMHVIKKICDRVGILENGQLIEEDTVSHFFSYPKTPTAKQFIASSIRAELPTVIKKQLSPTKTPSTTPVLRLWLLKETASQPLITQLSKRFDLDINILQANIEYIQHHALGIMIINLVGDESNIQQGLDYLQTLNINVEVLGYVRDHALRIN